MKSMIIYPLLTWHSELVHRDQMLAKEFAKEGVPTYFISRVTRQPWRILGKAQIRFSDGLSIITIFTLPYFRGRLPIIYKLNNYLISKQLKTIYQRIDEPKVLYISNPDWAQHVSGIVSNDDEVVYDISDDYSALAKNAAWSKIVADNDKLAKKLATRLVATNAALLSGVDAKKQSRVITNGVDLSAFVRSKATLERGEYRKIAGFIGGIYEWVNLDLIEKTARVYPDVLFALVGPTDRGDELSILVKNNKNVQYLGVKPKKEIGNYFASFDVGMVPFVSEKKYPRLATVDSGKIYQYLYFGYPVVSTNYEQARSLKDIISVADNDKKFVTLLGEALEADRCDKRQDFAVDNSWANKAREILGFIND